MHYNLGLIGYPIKQSLSPWIHRQLLHKAALEGDYTIFEIGPDQSFNQEISHLRNSRLDGFNVTVPYKKQIMPYLDNLGEDAQAIGAVNTVVNNNGTWSGYNTDWIGFAAGLKHYYPSIVQNKAYRILVIGAGGAARGIFYGLMKEGFTRIDIANRTQSTAESIAALGGTCIDTSVMTLREAENSLAYYDLIIQTTNIGMAPHVNDMVISLEHLRADSIVSDIVYQPIETEFLHQAHQQGAYIHYGHTMLLFQAQYAFAYWTGQTIPVNDMEQSLKRELEGR